MRKKVTAKGVVRHLHIKNKRRGNYDPMARAVVIETGHTLSFQLIPDSTDLSGAVEIFARYVDRGFWIADSDVVQATGRIKNGVLHASSLRNLSNGRSCRAG